MEPVFVSLSHAMKLKLEILWTLYYSGTKNTVPNAYDKPTSAEAVARLIGNGEGPSIDVTSAFA